MMNHGETLTQEWPGAKRDRCTQVDGQLNELEKSSDKLRESIETLHQRMTSVLCEGSQPMAESPPPEKATLVPLAHRLRDIRRAIESAQQTVSSIHNRLEL